MGTLGNLPFCGHLSVRSRRPGNCQVAGWCVPAVIALLRYRPSRGWTGRAAARRAAVTAAAVLAVTASLAVLLAVLFHLGVAAVAVAVLGTCPGLYLAWAAVPGAVGSPADDLARGRRVRQWDPVDLGIHRGAGGGPMPGYVRRPHDDLLGAVLDPAVARGRLVVVRGGPSTGKSRAAYEALLGQVPDWRLDYPLDAAALAQRLDAGISSRTVLWLGEMRQYADAEGGPAVIGRLADVLYESGCLAVTTMSHQDWRAYISSAVHATRGEADPSGVTGRLLSRLPQLDGEHPGGNNPAQGGVADVPKTFTEQETAVALRSGDRALAAAVRAAAAAGEGGRVIQYLAGVPDLMLQYEGPGGDPYGQAIITAAMDAARLGCASPLPAQFLQEAAIGYLSAAQRARDAGTWWATALAYATAELKGAVRALEEVPLPRGGTAGYRVTGYLREHGSRARHEHPAPASLWDALLVCPASAADLGRLAEAAADRGLYCHAVSLWARAVSAGSPDAAARLLIFLRYANPGEAVPAALWAAGHASLADPDGLSWLLLELRTVTAGDAVTALLARNPERHVRLDDPRAAAAVLGQLNAVGAGDAVSALLARGPFDHADLDDPQRVADLLGELGYEKPEAAVRMLLAGDPFGHADLSSARIAARLISKLRGVLPEAVAAVAGRAAATASLEDPGGTAQLLRELRVAKAGTAAAALLARDPAAHADLTELAAVAPLLAQLHAAGAGKAVTALAARIVAHVTAGHDSSLNDARTASELLAGLRAANAGHAAVTIAAYAAGHVSLTDPVVITTLLRQVREADDGKALSILLARDPARQVSISSTLNMPALLAALRAAGARDSAAILLERIPFSPGDLTSPRAVTSRLRILRAAGDDTAVAALLSQDPASQADLGDTPAVASLMLELHQAGDSSAAAALASRAAREVHLADPGAVARLLTTMRHCGAGAAITALLGRGPARHAVLYCDGARAELYELLWALHDVGADGDVGTLAKRCYNAGMFSPSHLYFTPQYPHGREPDGTSSPPWKWQDPAV